jgi:hypothetical protein
MRLALTKNQNRSADVFCDEARYAKQTLQRVLISQVSIDHYLNGRESGYQFVRWALSKGLMPAAVILTEASIEHRNAMGSLLERQGYRSADGMNFVKYH